jgi:peptidoglycan hydrolase CwlO-like protein
MEKIEVFYIIGGIGLSIISFFLKKTMSELEHIKEVTYETKNRLNVLENDYTNKVQQLNEKIDDLQLVIRELTLELKEFNKKVQI